MKAEFDAIFSNYGNIPQVVLDELFSLLSISHLEKGINIVRQGRVDNNDYFLLKGMLREYFIDSDGEEVTLNFLIRKTIVLPHPFRNENGRSTLSVQTLSCCIVGIIDTADLSNIRTKYPAFFNVSDLFLTNLFKEKIQKQITQLTQPAIEKLALFRIDYPGLENCIPHPYIASYLGITNVSLSRLRRIK